MRYTSHVSRKKTPQTEKADKRQIKNSAGGYTFKLNEWNRLHRFLILGNESGTYYASERKLTKENANCIEACLTKGYKKTIDIISEISDSGRAPKNDPAIFALAIAASHSKQNVRDYALANLSKVCRIPTHLFSFIECVRELRGGGDGLSRAIANWYKNKPVNKLAYQVLKYQKRGSYSHRDVLRLFGKFLGDTSQEYQAIFRYITCGPEWGKRSVNRKGVIKTYKAIPKKYIPELISVYEEVKKTKDTKKIAKLIREHRLTHEFIPTDRRDGHVWQALYENMPIGAMIRNVNNLTSNGVLKPLSNNLKTFNEKLTNPELLKRARIHPISVLKALKTYASGRGIRGSKTWTPIPKVIDILNDVFYASFGNIEPSNKRELLAIDVSGSMDGNKIAGMDYIDARMAAAAMSMVTIRSESQYHAVGFTSGGGGWHSAALKNLSLTKNMSLDRVVANMRRMPMGATDCSLPMVWALQNKIEVDTFRIYTDNETWHGKIHPHQALKQYRDKMGIPAKLIAIGFTATEYTIADPMDPNSLNCVGLDSAMPSICNNFSRDGF